MARKHLKDGRLNSVLFFIFYLMQIMPGACRQKWLKKYVKKIKKKEKLRIYLTPFEWQLRQVCALFTLEIVRYEILVTKC